MFGRPVRILLLAGPVAWIVWSAWARRWLTDDGFIYVRVVNQILDGNGPVFNAGERVEAATSTLWPLCLLVGKLLFPWVTVEWIAALLGIAMTAVAVTLAIVSAARLHRTWRLVPLGMLVYVVLPPAGEYATSGLEMSLTLLWLAGGWTFLVRATDQGRRSGTLVGAAIIGLGPLVRPDLAVMAGIMGLGLLLLDEPKTLRRLATIAACALTIPAAYEVFRMCYYGNLLPNPAYSKEATFANWPQGWQYLKDFERPYRLWVPALALLLGALVKPDVVRGRRGLAFFTPAVAGAVYAAFIVRGGGDFMHARMLLPATFALLLPVAAAPLRWSSVVALVAIILWTTVPLSAGGPPYREIGPFGITNERNVWAGKLENPVTLEDYASLGTTLLGKLVRADVDSGKTYVAVFTLAAAGSQPLAPSAPSFSQRGVIGGCSIGMLGVAAGDDIYVADECGLASPIGSRLLLLRRSRPGHEKILRPSWIFAMFGDPNAPAPDSTPATEIASARAALACPEIRAMLDRARAPLGWSRIAQNVVESFTAFRTRFHPDPATAAMHCGRVAGSDTPPSIMAAGRS